MTKNLDKIKSQLDINIDDKYLLPILFDINRYFDKQLTKDIQYTQKKYNRIFNSIERKTLRTYYYYNNDKLLQSINLNSFSTINYSDDDIDTVVKNTLFRLSNYDPKKILSSVRERYINLIKHNSSSVSYMNKWLKYYYNKRSSSFKYSAFILRITNKIFAENNYSEQVFYDLINTTYKDLENYRHLIIILDGQIYNKDKVDITWQLAYKLTIYAENFIQYNGEFFPCKKESQIKTLQNFIDNRVSAATGLAQDFYKNISTGYKFEDCFVSNNQNKIILTLKKIRLDESPIPCPACFTTIQSGNSYPEMFLRSYECKNPDCPERSKSGRGKRFDEYGVYRNFKLEENNQLNIIDNDLYTKWRRDIFDSENDIYEMILKYYTWNDETILTYNILPIEKTFSRKFLIYENFINTFNYSLSSIRNYDELPIVILFKKLNDQIHLKFGDQILTKEIEILQGNSTDVLQNIKPKQIGTAITSPPYYNAREYSQWENMLLYYIDMLINVKAIYNTLNDNGKYLYNIGDIVCEDNVYVKSNMSKRRLPLGFLSCMIFEIAGFHLQENIIWDKGEVQSKRNSTINLVSGYVKCINCYEHVFVFGKKNNGENHKRVVQITPVIKINSKGENTYKHTAPYPLDLVNLIKPYLDKSLYVLDPYLGSGTTLKWCRKNKVKGIGIELDKTYFELCKKYIYSSDNEDLQQLTMFDQKL